MLNRPGPIAGTTAPCEPGPMRPSRSCGRKWLTCQYSMGQANFPCLALSEGGEHGAFGAGLLNGWSQSGQRPTFSIVTGISTGALMAPVAFLGSAYDQRLKALYTDMSFHGILSGSPLFRKVLLASASVPGLFDPVFIDAEANGHNFKEMHATEVPHCRSWPYLSSLPRHSKLF